MKNQTALIVLTIFVFSSCSSSYENGTSRQVRNPAELPPENPKIQEMIDYIVEAHKTLRTMKRVERTKDPEEFTKSRRLMATLKKMSKREHSVLMQVFLYRRNKYNELSSTPEKESVFHITRSILFDVYSLPDRHINKEAVWNALVDYLEVTDTQLDYDICRWLGKRMSDGGCEANFVYYRRYLNDNPNKFPKKLIKLMFGHDYILAFEALLPHMAMSEQDKLALNRHIKIIAANDWDKTSNDNRPTEGTKQNALESLLALSEHKSWLVRVFVGLKSSYSEYSKTATAKQILSKLKNDEDERVTDYFEPSKKSDNKKSRPLY